MFLIFLIIKKGRKKKLVSCKKSRTYKVPAWLKDGDLAQIFSTCIIYHMRKAVVCIKQKPSFFSSYSHYLLGLRVFFKFFLLISLEIKTPWYL